MSDEKMLTVREVAETMRVKEWTVRRWLREGKLQGYRPESGRKILIKQSDLEKFLKPREGKQ